ARPTCRSASGTGKATTRCTGRPTILGTSSGRPAGLRAARRRRSPPASCRSNSARTSAAPLGRRGFLSHKPSLDLVPQRGSGPPQTPAVPVRGDLAVIGPMARSAADLARELAIVAGPDELAEGVGYKLALPPPRHDKLADFRVLVIDAHPLCATAPGVRTTLAELAERLAKLGCQVLRTSPKLPHLAETSRIYRQLLAA